MHYLLYYEAADDYTNKRAPFRGDHLQKIQQAYQRGEIVLAGALADPADGAVLVFRDPAKAAEFAKSDPYVLNGVVRSWRVRTWTTVIGDGIFLNTLGRRSGRPEPAEYPPYAKAYIDAVAGDDALHSLTSQLERTAELLRPVSDRAASEFSYAPGKWTLKQVLGHIIDTERIFSYRAVRIARGDATPLPGFEQDDYVKSANFNGCPLPALIEEFRLVRRGTIALFQGLSEDAWRRVGVANQFNVSVRGIAFLIAGHAQHHLTILQEKYRSLLALA